MHSLDYCIHDLIRIRIRGLTRWALGDLNSQLSYFETAALETPPDLSVEIGPFEPCLEETLSVDQRYFVREDYLFLRESDKGLQWQAEIQGLDQERTFVRFWAAPRNRIRWPWTLFPDLVLHHYVLQPLLERKLLERGCFLLHAGGVAREGKALLLIGRGGTYKTTLVLRLLREGYQLLGDDFVLIQGQRVFSFPTSPLLLEFTHRFLADERLNLRDQFRLGGFLLGSRRSTLPFVSSAELEQAVILLSQEEQDSTALRDDSDGEKLERIVTNQLLERTSYVSYRYRIGQFLEAYDYVFPKPGSESDEAKLRESIHQSFDSIPIDVLTVPRDPAPSVFEHLTKAITKNRDEKNSEKNRDGSIFPAPVFQKIEPSLFFPTGAGKIEPSLFFPMR